MTSTSISATNATHPRWTTASFGTTPDTSAGELHALGVHLHQCRGAHQRLFALQCALQTAHHFIAPRTVTLLVLLALLVGAASFAA